MAQNYPYGQAAMPYTPQPSFASPAYQQGVNVVGPVQPMGAVQPIAQPRPQSTFQPQMQPNLQQSQDNSGCLLGRPVSSREEFLAIPSDLYGRPTFCPDLRNGVIYYKRLNPDTGESFVDTFYSAQAWQQLQVQQQPVSQPQFPTLEQFQQLVDQVNDLEERIPKPKTSTTASATRKGE